MVDTSRHLVFFLMYLIVNSNNQNNYFLFEIEQKSNIHLFSLLINDKKDKYLLFIKVMDIVCCNAVDRFLYK